MIELKNVSKWYGSFQVLNDCSTNIQKGEVVVVCGPSGSGKSTLIKTINASNPSKKVKFGSTACRYTTRKPSYRNCAAASAWCFSTLSCFRTCR